MALSLGQRGESRRAGLRFLPRHKFCQSKLSHSPGMLSHRENDATYGTSQTLHQGVTDVIDRRTTYRSIIGLRRNKR